MKLNDGLDESNDEPISPKPKKKRNYLPSRSGPSSTRQRAQTTITSPPAWVLPCIPATKTTQQPKKSSTSAGVETKSKETFELGSESLSPEQRTTSGIQTTSTDIPTITKVTTLMSTNPISGVQSSVSGVQTATTVSANTFAGVHSPSSGVQHPPNSTNSTDIAPTPVSVLPNDDKLPDLVRSSQTETDNYSVVLDTVPPVGDLPPYNIFNGGTTEEEFDAVDALLSLSTVRDNATETLLDDNSSLMPIGGNSIYQDVNPVTVHLDQVSVDGAIARIVQDESISEAVENGEIDKEPPLDDVAGVQLDDSIESRDAEWLDPENTPVSGIQNTLSGVQTASSGIQNDDTNRKDDEPRVEDNEDSKNLTKAKGYVKVTTHGIRKKTNSDSRSYRCSVCGIRKWSAHNLNVHHRKRHSAQMCGVCGKFFDLASSLSHHMYTHNE